MTLLLGIDIGGTKSAALIGDAEGNVLARVSALTPQTSFPDAYAVLLGLVGDVCREYGVPLTDLAAVGVSCGGPLDSRTGLVHAPPNLPHWVDVPRRALVEGYLGLPVTL